MSQYISYFSAVIEDHGQRKLKKEKSLVQLRDWKDKSALWQDEL